MRPGGSRVSTVSLRGIQLARYVREFALLYAVHTQLDENGEVVFVQPTGTGDEVDVALAARQRPPRQMTDKFLRDVARVYTKAKSKPVIAVMQRFGSSRPTAGQWVMVARERGFLAPSTRKGRR